METAKKAAMKISCLWAFPALFRVLLPSMNSAIFRRRDGKARAAFEGLSLAENDVKCSDYRLQTVDYMTGIGYNTACVNTLISPGP